MAELVTTRKVFLEDVPIERAWELLTTPAQLRRWYAPGGAQVDLQVGGALAFRWAAHGHYRGQVTMVDEPTTYAYRLSQLEDEPVSDATSTDIEFTLEALDGGTVVIVRERGFEQVTMQGVTPKQLAAAGAQAWAAAFHELHRVAGE